MEYDLLFEIVEPRDYTIRLYKDRWEEHIISPAHHPEMASYLSEVREVIENPDYIQQSNTSDDTELYYKLGAAKGKYKHLYVVVVVRFPRRDHGYVRTAYLMPSPRKGGDIVWIKPRL